MAFVYSRFFLAALFMLSVLTSAHVTHAGDKVCNTIRVNSATDWYPVSSRTNAPQNIHGIGFDIAMEVFRQLNITVSIEPQMPWTRILFLLDQGDLDLILGAYWTEERRRKYHYSSAITTDEIAIFVRKGETGNIGKVMVLP